MDELVRMSPEDFGALGHQMRLANTGRLKAILDQLEPYCDGTMGSVSPPHVAAYIKTVRELGLLWRAYDRPEPVVEVSVEQEALVLEARQAAVLAEFDKLREVGMKNARRRVS